MSPFGVTIAKAVAVNPADVLARVEQLPISRWQYRDTEGVDHIGPMAQDFYSAFGLGASETSISAIDTGGVALAAVKALAQENAELKTRLAALERQQADLQAVMSKLVQQREERATPVSDRL